MEYIHEFDFVTGSIIIIIWYNLFRNQRVFSGNMSTDLSEPERQCGVWLLPWIHSPGRPALLCRYCLFTVGHSIHLYRMVSSCRALCPPVGHGVHLYRVVSSCRAPCPLVGCGVHIMKFSLLHTSLNVCDKELINTQWNLLVVGALHQLPDCSQFSDLYL